MDKSITFTITVKPVPDYDLVINPATQVIFPGETATETLSIIPKDGFEGHFHLITDSLLPGFTVTFLPPTLIQGQLAEIQVKADEFVVAGDYNFKITSVLE